MCNLSLYGILLIINALHGIPIDGKNINIIDGRSRCLNNK